MFKSFIISLSVLLIITTPHIISYGAEIKMKQSAEVENNKAVVSIQKQPTQGESQQKAGVRNNWFCIVLQVNGKVKDNNTADK